MPEELKPTKRRIPQEVRREFTPMERDHFFELAGYFEFDEGDDGETADRKAIFAVWDAKWKQKASDMRSGKWSLLDE